FGKPLYDMTVCPAALLLQSLRQIPIEQRHPGLDACLQELVHQAAVVVEPARIYRAAACRHNARPGNGKAISVQAEITHHGNVFGKESVVVGGCVCRLSRGDLARRMSESVPNGFTAAVFVPRPFNLKGAGRRSPEKILRKGDYMALHDSTPMRISEVI